MWHCAIINSSMSLKINSYKGARDLYPDDMALRNYIFAKWRQVVKLYGYREYMAPLLEPIEVYAAKSSQEIVSEQTYSFVDRGGRNVVIRPEMTPSISRMMAARRQETPLPARMFSIANFMRYERPQHGREREFWQLNFDLFGVDGLAADIEILEMASDLMTVFGATEEMFTIRLNDRQFINHMLTEYLGVNGDDVMAVIRLIDRYHKMSADDFMEQARELLGVTRGERLTHVLCAKSIADLPMELAECSQLARIQQIIDSFAESGPNNIVFDITLMRGFDYYTGVVFEVFDESPQNKRAIFGGGRYDGLVSLFGAESLPVVGAAPGETMVIEFLRAHNLIPGDIDKDESQLAILTMGDDEAVQYFSRVAASQLRDCGIPVSVDFSDRKLDKKTKAAVKMGFRFVAYVGQDEAATGLLTLKDLRSGEQSRLDIDGIIELYLTNIGEIDGVY